MDSANDLCAAKRNNKNLASYNLCQLKSLEEILGARRVKKILA